jgi:poly-gamma-glutamate synthesis protein (capsule biosynthesis protein)
MRKILKTLLVFFSLVLACELVFLVCQLTGVSRQQLQIPEITAPPETTQAPTTVPPEPEVFTLTFTGDFTPGCMPGQFENPRAYVGTVGEDYEYPFAHVRHLFEEDDFTFLNLEVVLGVGIGRQANKTFVFSGPEEYVQIMTSSSVEGVTLANNHSEDFGTGGYENTRRVLEENGIIYVEKKSTTLYTTESGLTIGLYADCFNFSESDIWENIACLWEQGAEIVICAFHWGAEGAYQPNDKQVRYAHAAIDAGANLVVGNHPHVLQPIEAYHGGLIYYSLGNFSFGGNDHPKDYDSAIIQQQILRDHMGLVSIGETIIVPISISSAEDINNYQPIPYSPEDEGYQRVLDKLGGDYGGPNMIPSYG